MKKRNDLLVIIPHSGLARPKEIKSSWLSKYNHKLLHSEDCETDRGTDKLYDFRKILGNKQLLFPISQIYLNICRDPNRLDWAAPFYIRNTPVYKEGKEPSDKFRKMLLQRYSLPFYNKLKKMKKLLALNGHSTITGHESLNSEDVADIDISEHREVFGKVIQCAPKEVADFYADELRKRLPNLRIERNTSYSSVQIYDYICDYFGWDGKSKKGFKFPIIHQETNENLYIENNRINYRKLNTLKNAFAESLSSTINLLKKF